MATLTFTPASGSIVHAKTVVRVNVAAADQNHPTTGAEKRYTILFDNPAGDDGRSYVFDVGHDGKHEFNSYVFPNAGTWSVKLIDEASATVVTSSVVVS